MNENTNGALSPVAVDTCVHDDAPVPNIEMVLPAESPAIQAEPASPHEDPGSNKGEGEGGGESPALPVLPHPSGPTEIDHTTRGVEEDVDIEEGESISLVEDSSSSAEELPSPVAIVDANQRRSKRRDNSVDTRHTPPTPANMQGKALRITLAITVIAILFVSIYIGRSEREPVQSIFLADHLQTHSAVPLFSRSETPDDVAHLFLRGYALMRDVCLMIATEQGWRGHHIVDHDFTTTLTSAPDQPYYCMNNLLNTYAGEDILTLRQRQQQKWAAVKHLQGYTPTDSLEFAEKIVEIVSLYRSPEMSGDKIALTTMVDLANASIEALGYLKEGFLYRDLAAIAAPYPMARVLLLPYGEIRALAIDLIAETTSAKDGKPGHCVCGPHLGMPRSVVISITAFSSKLFIEPKIIKLTAPTTTKRIDDLSWNKFYVFPKKETHGSMFRKIDAEFVRVMELDDKEMLFYDSVVVESINMEHDKSKGPKHVTATETRVIKALYDSDAHCIQYCHHLAFGLMDVSQDIIDDNERLSI